MPLSAIQNRPPVQFPRWLGPAWLFLVYLQVGYDWASLLLYGGAPWLGAWGLWWVLARTRYVREMSASAVDNVWRWGGRAIWLLVIVLTGGIYFANHNLPKGPLVDTGDVVCQNDDQGPCGEQYIEDTQRLNISAEAKFLKGSEAEILLLGLVFTGIFASKRPSGGYTKKSDGY